MKSRKHAVVGLLLAMFVLPGLGCDSTMAPEVDLGFDTSTRMLQTFNPAEEYTSASGNVTMSVLSMLPGRAFTFESGQPGYIQVQITNNSGSKIGIRATVVEDPSWNPGFPGEVGPFESGICIGFDPGEIRQTQIGMNGTGVVYRYMRVVITHGGCGAVDDTIDGFALWSQ